MAAVPLIPWRISYRVACLTGLAAGFWLGIGWAAVSDRLVMR